MSHFAEIDDNNFVIRVLVGDTNDPNGDEGYSWFVENLGGRWVQTSYNNNFRKKYAALGDHYNEELDAFITPALFSSWTLNEETCEWEPPIPKPDGNYDWDEPTTSWIEVTE
jgi:hypothetical protein